MLAQLFFELGISQLNHVYRQYTVDAHVFGPLLYVVLLCMRRFVLPKLLRYALVEIPLAPPIVATANGGPCAQKTMKTDSAGSGTLRLSRHETDNSVVLADQRGVSGSGSEPIPCGPFLCRSTPRVHRCRRLLSGSTKKCCKLLCQRATYPCATNFLATGRFPLTRFVTCFCRLWHTHEAVCVLHLRVKSLEVSQAPSANMCFLQRKTDDNSNRKPPQSTAFG